MRRRDLLGAAAAFALPWRRLRAETGGWRTFEVTTRAEISRPQGVSRAWLPLPLPRETGWQRPLGNTWTGNAARVEERRVGKYGVTLLFAEWAPGTRAPFLELKSLVATRDRTAPQPASLSRAEIGLYVAPTEAIPCDGIVGQTALRATRGARTDLDKARAIYDWIVENTERDPRVRGCGTGNVKALLESGNLGGKCADLNGLFVGLCRSLGIPARDVFGIRTGAPSITKSQHCRAEFFLEGTGWVPVDPADVRKLMLEKDLPLSDPAVQAARRSLFGAWEMSWIAFNAGHDVELPESQGARLPFLMYPNGETGGERLDPLDPEHFTYSITARQA